MASWLGSWQDWLWSAGILFAAVAVGRAVHFVLFAVARRLARRTGTVFDDALVRRSNAPARAMLPVLAAVLVLPFFRFRRKPRS